MGRFIPLALVLLALLATAGVFVVPWVACPDCPPEVTCIRCEGRGWITLVNSRRREPLHPVLVSLLHSRGVTAPIAGELAARHGRPRREVLGWGDDEEFFYYADATLVEGPRGPLVLVVLSWKTCSADKGSPYRILLFDRAGKELDRRDASMPGHLDFSCHLEKDSPVSVRLKPSDRGDRPAGAVRIASGNAETFLPRKDWPRNWEDIGIARIVSRDGKLEVIPP